VRFVRSRLFTTDVLLVIDTGMFFRVFRRVVCSDREIGHVLKTHGLARIVFAQQCVRFSRFLNIHESIQWKMGNTSSVPEHKTWWQSN
jgi:hypothetical protein